MNRKAVFATLAGGVLWGIISIFIRQLNQFGFMAMGIAHYRSLLSFLILGLWLLLRQPEAFRISLKDIWMFAGTGIISLTLFNFFYFSTITISEASIAVALLYTSPVFIMLISAICFHERITRRKIVSLVLTVLGCSLSAGLLGGSGRISLQVLLMGLGSGLFYGLYSIFGTFALRRYSSMTVTLYTFLFAILGTSVMAKPIELAVNLYHNPQAVVWFLGLAFFSTILPYLLYTYGLSRLSSGAAGIFVTVEPVVGNLIGLLIWKEPVGLIRWLGMGLILAAIILLNGDTQKEGQ